MQQGIRSIERSAPRIAGRGGEALLLRAIRPADAARLHDFLLALSLRSLQQRFWSGGPNLLRLTRELTAAGRCGIVACDRSGAIVAHGEYALLRPGTAEVAVVVADHHQGHGLGTRLVGRLTRTAADAGITHFVASVHPDNGAMLRVFTHHFGASVRGFGDESRVVFELAPTAVRHVA